jgi:hypothetical protein
VGLIARELEAQGVATVTLSSARSITQAVNPPRAVYLDYPLGQTAGRQDDLAEQKYVMAQALRALEEMTEPGTITDLGLEWSEDASWKDRVMQPKTADSPDSGDDRLGRTPLPRYQFPEDEDAADQNCPSCVFLAGRK